MRLSGVIYTVVALAFCTHLHNVTRPGSCPPDKLHAVYRISTSSFCMTQLRRRKKTAGRWIQPAPLCTVCIDELFSIVLSGVLTYCKQCTPHSLFEDYISSAAASNAHPTHHMIVINNTSYHGTTIYPSNSVVLDWFLRVGHGVDFLSINDTTDVTVEDRNFSSVTYADDVLHYYSCSCELMVCYIVYSTYYSAYIKLQILQCAQSTSSSLATQQQWL